MIPNNACTLRITAAAGTELAGASSAGTVRSSSLLKEVYDPKSLRPSRGIAGSGFRPLSNIPNCCLPWESGPCFSSSVADHPLRPATHRRHGRPLPHHQTNGTQPDPFAPEGFTETPQTVSDHSVLALGFPELSPAKGYVSYVLRTRAPLYSHPKVLSRTTCMFEASR